MDKYLIQNFKGKIHIISLNYHLIVNVLFKLSIVAISHSKLSKNVNVSLITKIPFIKLLKLKKKTKKNYFK